jgi:Mn-dependent DtxR family transcriptional regulator
VSELDVKEIVSALNVAPERVVAIIDKLVAAEKISMSKYGKLKINS